MILKLTSRFLTETTPRLLWKFSYNFGYKGMRSVQRFQKRLNRGIQFPAFLFVSVTNRCNLQCRGCWVTPTPPTDMNAETLNRIIAEGKANGISFFGILGGEPLLHDGLFDVLEQHPECYFLLFTNGMMMTDQVASRMRTLGNVSPLISIEGDALVSDERRQGKDVYLKTMEGLAHCREHRLIIGAATSVCKSNIDTLVTDEYLTRLIERNVHYVWYYIYRPVGPSPTPELVLSEEEILRLRQFMVDARSRHPIMIVDAYWDHDGNALCPAATGIGHHINPAGFVEPCPPVQFSGDRLFDGKDMTEMFTTSAFLKTFRGTATKLTRGCLLMEHPDLLAQMAEHDGVYDSSGRGTGLEELAAMKPHCGHYIPGKAIPETYWPYRFAKKHWFFGFGAYG